MSDQILHEILQKLGSIEAGQSQLRNDFDRERDQSRESRGDLHEKVDGLTGRIAHVETTIQVAGQVTAQTRDKIGGLEATLTDDIKPTVDEFKRIKLMGRGVIVAAGIAGGSLGLTFAWWGEQAISAIRSLLRIS